MELELRQTLSTKQDCVLSIADQHSAVTREFFGVTFPFKYIFVNSFDLSVPKLVAIMGKGDELQSLSLETQPVR